MTHKHRTNIDGSSVLQTRDPRILEVRDGAVIRTRISLMHYKYFTRTS